MQDFELAASEARSGHCVRYSGGGHGRYIQATESAVERQCLSHVSLWCRLPCLDPRVVAVLPLLDRFCAVVLTFLLAVWPPSQIL